MWKQAMNPIRPEIGCFGCIHKPAWFCGLTALAKNIQSFLHYQIYKVPTDLIQNKHTHEKHKKKKKIILSHKIVCVFVVLGFFWLFPLHPPAHLLMNTSYAIDL